VKLFHRTTRSVSLSEAGERFLSRVRPALREIAEAMEGVNAFRDKPAGTLRINTAAAAARRLMDPLILPFLRRYPDMRIDIVTDGRLVDIVAGGFDAGIRLKELVPQDMVAVPCTPPMRFRVVGAPSYFRRHPAPRSPADLTAHVCVRRRMPSGAILRWELEKNGEAMPFDARGPLTLDTDELMVPAAVAGHGLVWVNEWSVEALLSRRRLISVLDDWSPPFPGLCLYYPPHRHPSAGLRALVAMIRELGLERTSAWSR
jgi:DNA-binding transcriptional LysR family regulator